MPTGGQIVATTLAQLGVDTVFSVSGNQILPIYDAAPDAGLRLVHLRHESAAAYAAAGWSEIAGRPGVALVSAGPGFLAALTGVAVARGMELPLLFLSGASPVGRDGAFQQLDQARAAGAACKASLTPTTGGELAGALRVAWRLARDGVPGPVHVGLPADLLLAEATTAPPSGSAAPPTDVDADTRATLREVAARLERAERPVIVARPAAARGAAGAALATLAEWLRVPALVTESPRGLSDLKYAALVGALPDSDCALVVAPADFAVGFLAPDAIARDGAVLLLDAPGDPEPTRAPALRCRLAPVVALPLLADLVSRRSTAPEWSARLTARAALPAVAPGDGVHPLDVAAAVRAALRPEDVVVLDGGEFCQWVRLGLRDIPNRVLWNGKLGAIGGSIPLALGAAATGARRVIALLGDGSAGYHLSEFETATRRDLPVVAIVGNDARWAAEWHQQIQRYGPDRAFATELLPARYDEAAHGFGARGARADDAEALRQRLRELLAAGEPGCLNVAIRSVPSPAAVLPD